MLISRFLNEHQLSPSLPALTSGLVAGILVVMLQISFAALIFSGDLSDQLPSGIGMMLFGAFVIGIVVALTSSFPGAVACLQGSPAVVLALMAGAVAFGMPVAASPEDTFVTIVAAMGLTSLFRDLFFLGLELTVQRDFDLKFLKLTLLASGFNT